MSIMRKDKETGAVIFDLEPHEEESREAVETARELKKLVATLQEEIKGLKTKIDKLETQKRKK